MKQRYCGKPAGNHEHKPRKRPKLDTHDLLILVALAVYAETRWGELGHAPERGERAGLFRLERLGLVEHNPSQPRMDWTTNWRVTEVGLLKIQRLLRMLGSGL